VSILSMLAMIGASRRALPPTLNAPTNIAFIGVPAPFSMTVRVTHDPSWQPGTGFQATIETRFTGLFAFVGPGGSGGGNITTTITATTNCQADGTTDVDAPTGPQPGGGSVTMISGQYYQVSARMHLKYTAGAPAEVYSPYSVDFPIVRP
jgi:hypothetical protein